MWLLPWLVRLAYLLLAASIAFGVASIVVAAGDAPVRRVVALVVVALTTWLMAAGLVAVAELGETIATLEAALGRRDEEGGE